MTPTPRRSPAFRVAFDDAAFEEDLAHSSAAARAVAIDSRRELEARGVVGDRLRACDAEGRDGTRLSGCVKTYLPAPRGPWGMVFDGKLDTSGRPLLVFLAFGERHPTRAFRPSVYQVADRRLHAS